MKNPTAEFLESVVAVLRMNDQERQFLFLYATGELPRPPARPTTRSIPAGPNWSSASPIPPASTPGAGT